MIYKGDKQVTPALTDLLDDNNVSPSKTFSSEKINSEINNKLNKNWSYVGILSAKSGSVLTVGDDWTELCTAIRISEGSYNFNLSNVTPKQCFTQGSPNWNATFIGFYWNDSYNAKIRLELTGNGNNRQIKLNYSDAVGWGINGIYVWKR